MVEKKCPKSRNSSKTEENLSSLLHFDNINCYGRVMEGRIPTIEVAGFQKVYMVAKLNPVAGMQQMGSYLPNTGGRGVGVCALLYLFSNYNDSLSQL